MRTALLTSGLMMVAVLAWAGDEPSAPDAKAQPTAAAAATKPAEQKEQATANATTTASAAPQEAAKEDDKVPFKPPAGYRPKRINGEQVWCAKQVVLGSRFPKDDCRNEAELREMIRNRESMRNDMDRRMGTCTSAAGCAFN